VEGALRDLSKIPPVDRLVVCHGDACCPNTLLGPDGRWVAHVDLGQLGTADRWADLAVATWSTAWNYGPGWEPTLVFRAPEGGPVRLASWRRRFWAPAIARAGLAPLRPHDMRHSAVSLWVAAGASPKEVASRAGHSSVVTVLDRYGHLLPGSEDRVNDALDALAAAVPSPKPTAQLVVLPWGS